MDQRNNNYQGPCSECFWHKQIDVWPSSDYRCMVMDKIINKDDYERKHGCTFFNISLIKIIDFVKKEIK
jgi:hypothetical protein